MTYKPSDLYITVIDFFEILIPGSVQLFLIKDEISNLLDLGLVEDPTANLLAFAVGSLVLGHLLLGVGVDLNKFLKFYISESDDEFYCNVKGKIISSDRKIKTDRTDAFYRAYTYIRINNAPALLEIERQMAHYKMFRSLTLVFLIDFLIELFRHTSWYRPAISGFLVIISFYRFLFLMNWTYRVTFESYDLLTGSDQQKDLSNARNQGSGCG